MALQIVELAPAKVNLWLRVLGRRPDGYHEIETILQTIDLADRLILEEAEAGIRLECSDPRLSCDESNLVYQAAKLLRSLAPDRGAHIYLEKNIPWQAGLGGGSSDAAAALRGLNRLWELGLATEDLLPMASSLGSDVSFFLTGGTAVATGRGENIRTLPLQLNLALVLIKPPFGLSTPQVYSQWAASLAHLPAYSLSDWLVALPRANIEELGLLLHNDLEEPAFRLQPQLAEVKRQLQAAGFPTLLSGSGSCLFALLPNTEGSSASGNLSTIRRLLPDQFRCFLTYTRF